MGRAYIWRRREELFSLSGSKSSWPPGEARALAQEKNLYFAHVTRIQMRTTCSSGCPSSRHSARKELFFLYCLVPAVYIFKGRRRCVGSNKITQKKLIAIATDCPLLARLIQSDFRSWPMTIRTNAATTSKRILQTCLPFFKEYSSTQLAFSTFSFHLYHFCQHCRYIRELLSSAAIEYDARESRSKRNPANNKKVECDKTIKGKTKKKKKPEVPNSLAMRKPFKATPTLFLAAVAVYHWLNQ